MPRGLNRSGDFRNGTPITLPHEFGNPITEPKNFGNPVDWSPSPTHFGNPVTWPTPDPAHFGNPVGPSQQATPTFSPVGGTYVTAEDVTITSAGADTIYYTNDGSTPTTGSTVYSGPVHVAASQTLKALAVKSGLTNSAIGTAVYTINIPLTAPTIVQTAVLNTASNTVNTITFGSPVTAGNSVYLFLTLYSATHVVPQIVTDDAGNRYGCVSGIDGDGSVSGSTANYIYRCENIVGAPTVITVEISAGQYKQFLAVEVTSSGTGVPQVDNAQYVSTAATATPQPLTGPDITTAADKELLLGYVAQENNNNTFTPNTGWTAEVTNGNPANASSFLMSQAAAVAGLFHSTGGTTSQASGTGNYALAIKTAAAAVVPTPAYVQSKGSTGFNNATAPTVAFDAPVIAGHTVLVEVNLFDGAGTTISSVTDDLGNVYTSILGPSNSPTDGFGTGATRQLFASIGVTGTPQTITVNINAGSGMIVIAEFSGVTSVDATHYASTANTILQDGGAIVTTGANELLVAFMGYMNGSGGRFYTAGPGWTQFAHYKETAALGEQVTIQIQPAPTAGSYTVTSNLDNAPGGGGGSLAVALK